jgi:hypothetical protein
MEIAEVLVETLRVVVGGILFPHDCHGELSNRGMLEGSFYFFLLLSRKSRK